MTSMFRQASACRRFRLRKFTLSTLGTLWLTSTPRPVSKRKTGAFTCILVSPTGTQRMSACTAVGSEVVNSAEMVVDACTLRSDFHMFSVRNSLAILP
jgi:hypothetical protein